MAGLLLRTVARRGILRAKEAANWSKMASY